MKKLSLIFLSLSTFCLFPQFAHAQDASTDADATAPLVPLDIPATAALPLRSDNGQGFCGTFVTYTVSNPPVFPTSIDDTKKLLNGQNLGTTTPQPLPYLYSRVENINFSNGTSGSRGDFTLFPAPLDPSNPKSDVRFPNNLDDKFVSRMHGYINIPSAPAIETWALYCDDFCRLSVGGVAIYLQDPDQRTNARITRPVRFTKAGLYPIELLYGQVGTQALLELSRANGAIANGPTSTPINTNLYKLIDKTALFSSPRGFSADCKSCKATTDCSNNRFCNPEGLCQSCNTDQHCGASCGACGGLKTHCNYESNTPECVQCVVNADCTTGQVCNAQKACETKLITDCNTNRDCSSGYECNAQKKCVLIASGGDAGSTDSGTTTDSSTGNNNNDNGEITGSGGCSIEAVGQSSNGTTLASLAFLGLLGLGSVARARRHNHRRSVK